MPAETPEAGLYPIRVVAELTGINPVTIRAWERRYGLVQPSRTPGSHRLYSRLDLERLRAAARLVAAGVSISQAVRQLKGAANDAAPADRAAHWRDLLLQRLDALDQGGMHAALDGAEAERPGLSAAVLDLLAPAGASLPPLLARSLQGVLEARLALPGPQQALPGRPQLLFLLPPAPGDAVWLLALAATVAPGLPAAAVRTDDAAEARDALARTGPAAAVTHEARLAEAVADTAGAPLFSRAGSRRSKALGDEPAAARAALVATLGQEAAA